MSLLMFRKSATAHAADAHIDDIAYKYKVGDKIKTPDGVGTVQKKTHTNSGKPAYEVKLDKGGIVVHVEQSVSAAHAADASEIQRVEKLLKRELTDAEFWKLGDYVMKHMKVGKTFTDNELLSAVKDAAADAKDSARNVKYRGCEITVAYHDPDNVNLSGKTWIVKDVDGVSVGGFSSEAKAKAWIDAHPSRAADSNAEEIVNHDRIPVDQLGGEANARKHGYIIAKKGGRVYGVHIDGYSDKLAKKTIEEAGYTVVGDADELNNYADIRAALSKMADIAKRLTDAKVSFKAGWTPEGIGEIILEFPNIESARKYNYYKLFNAWDAERSQTDPRWVVNIGGYSFPRIEGNRMTIGILFST